MDMKMLRKTIKILVWLFLLIMLLATSLLADDKKTLPPAPPDTQEECDQTEPKATSSDSPIFFSNDPFQGKSRKPQSFNPASFSDIQESTNSGG